MNRRLFFVFICVSLVIAKVTAQHTVKGRVLDNRQQSVEFSNVVLYKVSDSVMVSHAITDAEGRFALTAQHPG